jgi:DNA repair exonuclease SbcCD ATPase subunit
MIRSLAFQGFGKFGRETFELAPVTVVFGPNEAGKTTFFDGLFQALCRPSEAKKSGKILKERYGAARQVSAVLAIDAPISDEEFLSLYAIRAGDLNLRLDQGTDWIEKLKARLFHGGLDPAALIAEFQKRSSDSRSVAVNKELEKAREAAARTRSDLEKLRREREGHLAREREVAGMEESLAGLRARMEADLEEARRLEAGLEAEERIAQRQKLAAQLARWEELSGLESEARSLEPFAEDRRAELEALAAATRSLAEAVSAGRGKRDQCADLLAESRTEARLAREAVEAAAPRAALARRLADESRALLAAGGGGMGRGGMIASAVCIAAALAGGLAAHGLLAWGAVLAGLAGAAISLFASLRMRQRAAARHRERALAGWKDEWTAAGNPSHGVAGLSSLEGFSKAMDEKAREKDAAEARSREAAARCETRQADSERADAEWGRRKDEEDAARRSERAWLQARGCETSAEYDRKTARAAQLRGEIGKRRSELEVLAAGGPLDAWRAEVQRKLRDLDRDGVPAAGRDDAAVQRMRNRKAELQREREAFARQEKDMIDRRAGAAGEIRGAIGKLAGEMVAAEDGLAAAEDMVRRLELDKRAAALTLSIFQEIGSGADMLLAGLSGEIGNMLARILPGERAVALAGLDEDRIRAGDAAGASRALPNLSTGTQHALVLAAKLAMARKHREGPGLFVLDEPFLAMDEARETRALEMLREFHLRHGWQLILLTKEARLRDKMGSLFADARIIELRASGRETPD